MIFKLVDAFTDKPLSGNPCAVVLGADDLSDEQMLAIAKEMNQSETAFLTKSKMSHLKARYFTPEREIPLAGHPTIASVHATMESGMIKLDGAVQSISLELVDGPIRVDIERRNGRAWIKMFQRKPQFLSIHNPKTIAALFGLRVEDFLENIPLQTVSTGTPMLMIPLRSKVALESLRMNIDEYKRYREKSDFFSPHFFILSGETASGNTFARHLGVPPDTMEDAFTGSASGCMGAYLWKYGLMKERIFTAEQGHWMHRPGQAKIEAIGDFSNLDSIAVSGTAVTVVTGELKL